MMTTAAASLGTNVITFDQALVTPPWKSTASGMNELHGSGVGRGRAIPARLTGCGRFLMESEAARQPRRCRVPRIGERDGGPGSGGLARNRAARLRVS